MPAGGHKPDDVEQPIAVGAQLQVSRAGPPHGLSNGCALLTGGGRVALPELAVPRLHLQDMTGLGSTTVSTPTAGSSSSRGSSTSTASTSWRPRRARRGRSHAPGSARKSETTTARPRRRGGRDSRPMAPARSVGSPGAALGVRMTWCISACAPTRPPRAGIRTTRSPLTTTAPTLLPPRTVRWVIAARAATARSRFSQLAVPKSRLADRSSSTQVSSSRSATVSRTCGTVVRAVTGQSIRRTSSPGQYSLDSPASLPGPGRRPR